VRVKVVIRRPRIPTPPVAAVIQQEQAGLQRLDLYKTSQRADTIKNELRAFLLEQKRKGKTVALTGPRPRNTAELCRRQTDLVPFVCDAAVSKQGKYMPAAISPSCPSRWPDRKPIGC